MPPARGPVKRKTRMLKKKQKMYSDFLERRRGVNPKKFGYVNQNQNYDQVNQTRQKYKNESA